MIHRNIFQNVPWQKHSTFSAPKRQETGNSFEELSDLVEEPSNLEQGKIQANPLDEHNEKCMEEHYLGKVKLSPSKTRKQHTTWPLEDTHIIEEDKFADIEGLDLMSIEVVWRHNEMDTIPPKHINILVVVLQKEKSSQ